MRRAGEQRLNWRSSALAEGISTRTIRGCRPSWHAGSVKVRADRIELRIHAGELARHGIVLRHEEIDQVLMMRQITLRGIQDRIFLRIVAVVICPKCFFVSLGSENVGNHDRERLLLAVFCAVIPHTCSAAESMYELMA